MNALSKKDKRRDAAFEVLMLILSLIIVIPLLIVILGSFKTTPEALVPNLKLPEEFQFSNYSYVFEKGKLGRAFFNSTFITVIVVIVCLITASACAYTISRREIRYTKIIDVLFKFGMIAPMSTIPTIRLMQLLHISGTYFSVIMLYIATNLPWSVFIYSNFMKNVPKELEEAAILDGCNALQMFRYIIFPVLKNVTITVIVVVAMGVWNEFMIPIYFFSSSSKWTLPLSVYNFYGLYFRNWNYVFADLVLTSLPLVILYLFAQKNIVDGLTSGSVKG